MDISEQYDHSIDEQIALFDSIRPLFSNKPVLIGLNKIDILRLASLPADKRAPLDKLANDGVSIIEMSTMTLEGVMQLRDAACDQLLIQRVEAKLLGKKVDGIFSRVYVAMPKPRDDYVRAPYIPDALFQKQQQQQMHIDGESATTMRKLERDIEVEMGDEYILDLKKKYDLPVAEEKYDIIPEIWEGHNIADFVDRNISIKLQQLKEAERLREEAGVYDSDMESDTSETRNVLRQARQIRNKQIMMRNESRAKKAVEKPRLSRSVTRKRGRTGARLEAELAELGVKVDAKKMRRLEESANRSTTVKKIRVGKSPSIDISMHRSLPRDVQGVRDVTMKKKAVRIGRKAQRPNQQEARKGEADHRVFVKRPKHLFCGKRGIGKTDRR